VITAGYLVPRFSENSRNRCPRRCVLLEGPKRAFDLAEAPPRPA
jgi:hypothetical protein